MSRARRTWMIAGSVVVVLVVLGCAAAFAAIESGIATASRSAMARFPGDRVEALNAMVDCAKCSVTERNKAVWALGQLHDRRALAVLKKHYTGGRCNHETELCQYELRKAVKAVGGVTR